jgi:hypothetical protein
MKQCCHHCRTADDTGNQTCTTILENEITRYIYIEPIQPNNIISTVIWFLQQKYNFLKKFIYFCLKLVIFSVFRLFLVFLKYILL